jgi:hypothetical protein
MFSIVLNGMWQQDGRRRGATNGMRRTDGIVRKNRWKEVEQEGRWKQTARVFCPGIDGISSWTVDTSREEYASGQSSGHGAVVSNIRKNS